jgi:hypothetical protein
VASVLIVKLAETALRRRVQVSNTGLVTLRSATDVAVAKASSKSKPRQVNALFVPIFGGRKMTILPSATPALEKFTLLATLLPKSFCFNDLSQAVAVVAPKNTPALCVVGKVLINQYLLVI